MVFNKKKNSFVILAFLLPSLIGMLFFNLIPILSSFFISLTKWDIIGGLPEYLGFKNYMKLLQSEEFWRTFKNTFYFIILYIPLILVTSLTVASLLNARYKGIKFYRTLFYIPVITSWVAGALIWEWVLNPQFGVVNTLLGYIGIQGPGWLYDKNWAMPGIVIASIWKDMGFFGLILLSGLQGIDTTYYEAAEIDGANWWQKFRKITFPLLSPTIFFVIIISIINSFQLFPQVMIMTEGGPHGSTQVMVERIYRYAFEYYKMGYATSFAWVLFIIIFTATLIQFRVQKRWVTYDS
jgi:multiple sugar transport system permease protein